MPYAIEADSLKKTFTGKHEVRALDGVSFNVEEGTVFGLLGPNGSGKTTAVRILTTILRSDSGSARVLGHDVVKKASLVRSLIGLAGQYAAVDENLTGRENLRMVGRLNHLDASFVTARATELLSPVRPGRCRGPAAQDLLGWHATSPRPGRGAGGPAHGALPRRAHHRARPPEPQRPVGGHREAGRGGHHRPPHDPVPRGGRSTGLRPGRHRPRTRHRRGHPERAQGRVGGDRARSGSRQLRRRPPDHRAVRVARVAHPDGQRLRRRGHRGRRSELSHGGTSPARPGGGRPHRVHPAGAQPGRRLPRADGPEGRGRDRGRRGPRPEAARPIPPEGRREAMPVVTGELS